MSALLETREPNAQYLEAASPSLVRQFELLAQAPGGVVRLRELILVLAVQGKLTRRDAQAEPASVLLARILKLKASLVDAGKAKRDKPLPAEDEADPPFDIPQSWCWIRLGSVTNYGSPNKGGAVGPETWVLDLEDIEKSTGRLLKRVRRSERPALSEKNSFQAGDVLYGKLRPYLSKVIVADEPGVCTTELVPFRCYGDWVPQYFRIALSSPAFLEYVNARSYGMKMPRLGTEDARMALLPLPPLEEQARIAARVDELMQLCDALEAKGRLEAQQHDHLLQTLLGTLTDCTTPEELATNWQRVAEHFDLLLNRPEAVDALEQTILQLAVRGLLVPQDPSEESASHLVRRIRSHREERAEAGLAKREKPVTPLSQADLPFEVPAGWEWVRFDELVEPAKPISYGVLVPGPDVSGGVPFVRIADLSLTDPPARPEKSISMEVDAQYQRTRLEGGEILMGVVGSIGKLGVAPPSWAGANIARAICRIVPVGLVNKDFVLLLLQSEFMRASFAGDTRTLAQPTLNVGLIRGSATPLPPIAEQGRIVARVTELRRLCANLRQRLDRSGATHAALAHALIDQSLAT